MGCRQAAPGISLAERDGTGCWLLMMVLGSGWGKEKVGVAPGRADLAEGSWKLKSFQLLAALIKGTL
jgi:hypothetical protein